MINGNWRTSLKTTFFFLFSFYYMKMFYRTICLDQQSVWHHLLMIQIVHLWALLSMGDALNSVHYMILPNHSCPHLHLLKMKERKKVHTCLVMDPLASNNWAPRMRCFSHVPSHDGIPRMSGLGYLNVGPVCTTIDWRKVFFPCWYVSLPRLHNKLQFFQITRTLFTTDWRTIRWISACLV